MNSEDFDKAFEIADELDGRLDTRASRMIRALVCEVDKQNELIEDLSQFVHQRGLGGQWIIWLYNKGLAK